MSSCNVFPVKLAINPSKTGGCAIKKSCNASRSNWALSLLFSTPCGFKGSCNASLLFLRFPRQYPGLASRHNWTLFTFSGPEKYPWFSGFASQRFWLAALLALRHSGLRQYFWRLALRGSGMNKSLQLQHFFLFIPAIGNHPPDRLWYEKK